MILIGFFFQFSSRFLYLLLLTEKGNMNTPLITVIDEIDDYYERKNRSEDIPKFITAPLNVIKVR